MATQIKQRAAQTFGHPTAVGTMMYGLFRNSPDEWIVEKFDRNVGKSKVEVTVPAEDIARAHIAGIIGDELYTEQEFNSVPVKEQRTGYGPVNFSKDGKDYRIMAYARHDDEAGNGHNLFMLTGMIQTFQTYIKNWTVSKVGPIHAEIVEHFPNLAPLVKWHLCTTQGPLHYITNTIESIKRGQLDYARKWAIWPDATDADLAVDLTDELSVSAFKKRMVDRLPGLMREFRSAVIGLGFSF